MLLPEQRISSNHRCRVKQSGGYFLFINEYVYTPESRTAELRFPKRSAERYAQARRADRSGRKNSYISLLCGICQHFIGETAQRAKPPLMLMTFVVTAYPRYNDTIFRVKCQITELSPASGQGKVSYIILRFRSRYHRHLPARDLPREPHRSPARPYRRCRACPLRSAARSPRSFRCHRAPFW